MNKLLTYSNSWGHLIISIVCIGAGVTLMLLGNASTQAIGTTLVLTTSGYWFISSSKSSGAEQISQELPGKIATQTVEIIESKK